MTTESSTGTTGHDPLTGEILDDNATIDALANEAASAQGQTLETIITPKSFLPPTVDADPSTDPRKLVGMQPLGSVLMLGALAGVINRVERHEHTLPDGKRLSSVWLLGMFEGRNYGTGEVMQAGTAILPRSYGDMIENVYNSAIAGGADPRDMRADLDIEIGVKHVKRGAITFQWHAVNFVPNPAAERIKAIRSRQDARLAGRAAAQLEAPKGPAPKLVGKGK